MDKKSKILIWIFTVLIIASIIFSAYRFLVLKNYVIDESQVSEDVVIEESGDIESLPIDEAFGTE